MTNVHFKVQSKYCRDLGETTLESKSYMKTEDRDKLIKAIYCLDSRCKNNHLSLKSRHETEEQEMQNSNESLLER